MNWFNYYGLAIMILIMVPNIIFSISNKEMFINKFNNKRLEIIEQIGRYGCFILMIFNIPYTYTGWIFINTENIYLIINSFLIISYILIWVFMSKKNSLIKAILLSVIPSIIFLFSGIMIVYIPLMIFSIIFAISYTTISVKNAR